MDQNSLAPIGRPPMPWGQVLLAAIVAALVTFPYLGLRDLWTPGEARVAQVARQMRETHTLRGYVVPRIGEDLRVEKPPLSYWLVVLASVGQEDVNEWNSRVPSALAAVALAALLARWGTLLVGGWGGLVAGVAVATTSACWWQARNSTIEMTHLFFAILAIFAWWRYARARKAAEAGERSGPGAGWLMLAYAALGLAAIDKGPIALVLLPLFVVVYMLARWRNPFRVRVRHHLAGLGVLLLITVPWVVGMLALTGGDAPGVRAVHEEWMHQFFGRIEAFDHREPDPTYYLVKLLGDGQPWVFFGLIGLTSWSVAAVRARRRKASLPGRAPGMGFVLGWAAVTLVFFSVLESKKSYYVLPIYPAFALAAAWLLEGLRTARWSATVTERVTRAVCAFSGAALAAAGLALPFLMETLYARFGGMAKYELPSTGVMLVAGAAVLGGWCVAWFATQRRWGALAAATAMAAAVAFGVYTTLVPALNAHKGDEAFCRAVRDELRKSDRVYTYAISGQPIYKYYLDWQVEPLKEAPALLLQKLTAAMPYRRFVAMERKDYETMYLFQGTTPHQRRTLKRLLDPLADDPATRMRWYATPPDAQGRWRAILWGYVKMSRKERARREQALKEAIRLHQVRAEEVREPFEAAGGRMRRLVRAVDRFVPVEGTGRAWLVARADRGLAPEEAP